MQTEKTASQLLRNLCKQGNSSQLVRVTPKTVTRTLLLSEETFATPLLLLLLDRYGPQVLQWAPETIRLELEDDFQLKLPKITLDKIMAAITIVTTNYFFKDVTKFIELCNILAGDDFQPDEFDPADAEEMLLAVTEALLLWPPDDDSDDTEFSMEIQEYIRQVLNEQGIIKPFDVLRLALGNDQSEQIDSEYADDPEMYAAIYDSQQSRVNDMKAVFASNMHDLAQQLSILPLDQGQTREIVQRIRQLIDHVPETV